MPAATKLGVQDIVVSKVVYGLLKANGMQDALNGVDMYAGWRAICEEAGFFPGTRTSAQEAYLDGYYAVQRKG